MTNYQLQELQEKRRLIKWSTIGIVILLFSFAGLLAGCPAYRVYEQKMEGKAKLAEAQSSRQVAVAEAKAKMESASLLAQADTIRAHGVARSNQIIGASLKNNVEYLHWLWIDNLDRNQGSVIYVPTEANLPILEASRFLKSTMPIE
jgi:predicted aminopeptidase